VSGAIYISLTSFFNHLLTFFPSSCSIIFEISGHLERFSQKFIANNSKATLAHLVNIADITAIITILINQLLNFSPFLSIHNSFANSSFLSSSRLSKSGLSSSYKLSKSLSDK